MKALEVGCCWVVPQGRLEGVRRQDAKLGATIGGLDLGGQSPCSDGESASGGSVLAHGPSVLEFTSRIQLIVGPDQANTMH